jgi:hypothetical protein
MTPQEIAAVQPRLAGFAAPRSGYPLNPGSAWRAPLQWSPPSAPCDHAPALVEGPVQSAPARIPLASAELGAAPDGDRAERTRLRLGRWRPDRRKVNDSQSVLLYAQRRMDAPTSARGPRGVAFLDRQFSGKSATLGPISSQRPALG